MPATARNALTIGHTRDERARQDFVAGLRAYVLNDLATHMKTVWDRRTGPGFEREAGRPPGDGTEVHRAIRDESLFQFYSALRCNAQEMVWRSVLPGIERDSERLAGYLRELQDSDDEYRGSLSVPEDFTVPRYVSELDVHLMPGNYHEEHLADDVAQGALFDNGLRVFSFGLLGERMDDITQSVSTFFKRRYPDEAPARILDLGCTLGHSTLPWKERYPDAEVHGIDVGAPCVRYGYARARELGVAAHFHQMNAEALDFEDASFDLVYSCMFLHELPATARRNVFAEAYRVLKPGGLMVHYELPPNSMTSAFDGFYLDWDSYYNKEPFYKGFRDADMRGECADTGFAAGSFFDHVVPSLNLYGEEALNAAVADDGGDRNSNVGRFADGVTWYFFGARKPA